MDIDSIAHEEPVKQDEPASSTEATSNVTKEDPSEDEESASSDHSNAPSPTPNDMKNDTEVNDKENATMITSSSTAEPPPPPAEMASSSSTSATSKKLTPPKKKTKKPIKYCKAPQAPKRFKSAFIFFTMARHSEIRKKLESEGAADKTPDVAKIISEEWRTMPPKERAVWDEKARVDKERYEIEKSMYTGPWKIPSRKRSQKDPDAPKRPMSSFLAFSNGKRSDLKQKNPNLSNTDISKLLAKMWKEASDDEKKVYIEKEKELREIYKKDMGEWREKLRKKQLEQEEQKDKLAKELMVNSDLSAGAAAAAAELSARAGNMPPEKVLEAARLQQQANAAGLGDIGAVNAAGLFGRGGANPYMNRPNFPQDFGGGSYFRQDQFGHGSGGGFPPQADGYSAKMMELSNHYRMLEMQQQMAQMAEYEQRYNQFNQSLAAQQFSQQGYPGGGNRDWHGSMNGATPEMLQQRMGFPIDPPGNNPYGSSFQNMNHFSEEEQLAHLLRRRQQKQQEQEQLEMNSTDALSNRSGGAPFSNEVKGLEPQGSKSSSNSPSPHDPPENSIHQSPAVSQSKIEGENESL